MPVLSRQLGLLPIVAIAVLATSPADAGLAVIGPEAQGVLTDSEVGVEYHASSSIAKLQPSEQKTEREYLLEMLDRNVSQTGTLPSSGGISLVTSGSSSAPATLLAPLVPPKPGFISRMSPTEAPFSPRMIVAEIFHPPRA